MADVAADSSLPPLHSINRRRTHRLIPAKFANGGNSVLARLSSDPAMLNGIFELDNATNDRLLAELGKVPGIDRRELIFGVPSASIVNAAFCHPAPTGSRFNSSERGAWYAGYEVRTSQAEVIHHRRQWLRETNWTEEDLAEYVDYLADFHGEFYDLRGTAEFSACLDPDSYTASQALAASLLHASGLGIIYPSVRRAAGTCLACFRPAIVTHVRRDATYRLILRGWQGPVKVEKL
ncbi:RES family NAD+ phosphorylase [Paracidobacterium acidisoli]|uniref:RES domain-containing protein n=1 Tax=Paracidobacterium acidisoli TaxID=2303751 RepID=A0A372ITQ7_9BACT|nr:RES family NAD+ phosphorylase [Paracidobacterium acidisoli]MBT9329698.1 RES family NAD+ phosphorylase [Paracidobacterium acidisoli]